MIGEPKPQASADVPDKSQHEANVGRFMELSSKSAGELSDHELETMLADRKALKSAQTEAETENAERDAETVRKAAEAKVAEEAARAEQVAAHATKEAEDATRAVKLAEQIKSGNIGESTEKGGDVPDAENKDKVRGVAYAEFQRMTDMLRGESEVALAEGDMQGFQEAYIKMTEIKIAELQFRIQGTDEDINDGSYQELQKHRPELSMERIRGIYEYQKKNLLDQIETLRSSSIELVKSNPKTVIMREYDEKQDKVNVLKTLLKEAHSFWMAARKDGREMSVAYPNAGAKVEGAVATALRYKDPKVIAFLKYTFADPLGMLHTYVVLSPELQQQIRDLKV